MSTLCDFLKKDYPSHFRITWDDNTMQIRKECPASVVFEIRDQQPTIVQPTGKGVSVIRKKDYSVEIVDFEAHCKTIHGKDNSPSCCDFIISANSPNDDKKVALFSCRLSDKEGEHPMRKSARQFSLPIMKLEKMRLHETLPHGFEFVMRVYNKEYEL